MELYRRPPRRNTHEVLCRFWPVYSGRQGAADRRFEILSRAREPQPDVRTRCNYATQLHLGQQASQNLIQPVRRTGSPRAEQRNRYHRASLLSADNAAPIPGVNARAPPDGIVKRGFTPQAEGLCTQILGTSVVFGSALRA